MHYECIRILRKSNKFRLSRRHGECNIESSKLDSNEIYLLNKHVYVMFANRPQNTLRCAMIDDPTSYETL